jgi:hypothetical protein
VFIRGGSYTENITLKDGVNLAAFTLDTNQVTISGTITMSSAGTVTISGITCQTNGATAVSFSSANLQTLTFTNCTLTSTNADLVTNSNSNASSNLTFTNCSMTAAATYKIFAASHVGQIRFNQCVLQGPSTTASTSTSSGIVLFFQGQSNQIFSLTGTTSITFYGVLLQTNNLTLLTIGTGTNGVIYNSRVETGTAIPFNVTSTGNVYCYNSLIGTSAATLNTGTGTFFNGSNTYSNTLAVTSTNSALVGTAFTKINVQTFTASGTYTPTASMKFCQVEVVGGGGGSGGTPATSATQFGISGSGGGGGYSRKTISAATIGASQTVTIGAAGTAGAAGANAGGTGGTTSLGSLIQATGGNGGGAGASTTVGAAPLGAAGGVGSLGDININGSCGGNGIAGANTSTILTSGPGGNSYFGGGPIGVSSGQGLAGNLYGTGASGNAPYLSSAALAGRAGATGFVVVTEYI